MRKVNKVSQELKIRETKKLSTLKDYASFLYVLIFICCTTPLISIADENNPSGMGNQIEFVEKESGKETAKIRILLNDEFLRVDSGNDVDDYILFNRQEGVIMNVTHSDKTVLAIEYSALDLPPLAENVVIDKTQAPLPDIPKINESELIQIVTTVNGKECKKTIVAVSLMPNAVAAMQGLNLILAEQYGINLNQTLMSSDATTCDMVVSTYEVNGDLIYGFPVQSNRANGWSRSLTDFRQNIKINPELFTVPDSYQSYWSPQY